MLAKKQGRAAIPQPYFRHTTQNPFLLRSQTLFRVLYDDEVLPWPFLVLIDFVEGTFEHYPTELCDGTHCRTARVIATATFPAIRTSRRLNLCRMNSQDAESHFDAPILGQD